MSATTAGIDTATMHYRRLGKSDVLISEIGFGAWGIGGSAPEAAAYGRTDDRASLAALSRAFELGVTFYDTADCYGTGRSEELLADAFSRLRHRVILASKGGFLRSGGEQDFSTTHLTRALEGSLRRLRSDYVDVYQLHSPPVEVLEAESEAVRWLLQHKRSGTIRLLGASVRSPQDGLTAVRCGVFDVIQVNFNLIDQRALESGLLGQCETAGVGIIARTPLCFGFLSGKYAPEHPFGADDHRSRWPAQQRALWARAPQLFAEAAPEAHSPAERALRFCLSYPAVSTVIPGMLTSQQVEENAAASAFGPLSGAGRALAEAVYRRNRFFIETPTT